MQKSSPYPNAEPDVVIIGAGPYGLSLAAHLRPHGVSFRIFGEPLELWRKQMPKGMHLKSDGFASNLYDPDGAMTLERYCADNGLPYDHDRTPVPLATFTAYGLAFQRQLVPDLQENRVVGVKRRGQRFEVTLDSGEIVLPRRVVVAAGINQFRHVPSAIAGLPPSLLTHSADHHDLTPFVGRHVIVLGGGSSASDTAALLNEAGAKVTMVARVPELKFHKRGGDSPRSLLRQLRHPSSGIGPGWRARIYCEAPWLVHMLPDPVRLLIVRRTLGPAGGWFIKDRVVGKVSLMLGAEAIRAEAKDGGVALTVRDSSHDEHVIEADHVIAATGYRVDCQRVQFLDPSIRSSIRTIAEAPALGQDFQSSIPGLYFVGVASASSFGPVMRFAFGAGYTAPHLARRLARASA